MVVLERMLNDGGVYPLALNVLNVIEATPKMDEEGKSWVKYWDGREVRSAVVNHTVHEVAAMVKSAGARRD